MKTLPVSKILLAAISVIFMNACSKSNADFPPVNTPPDSTIQTPAGQSFDLAYVITPLTSDIKSIYYNDENGNLVTANDMNIFPDGTKKLTVSATIFKAKISVDVANTTNHPIGFRLEIRVNGLAKQTTNFTAPAMSLMTASAEYTVQSK